MFRRKQRKIEDQAHYIDQLLRLLVAVREDAETERQAKLIACRQVAELSADLLRLHGVNEELRKRLRERSHEEDLAYLLQVERRVLRLQRGCARWMAALWDERAEVRRLGRESARLTKLLKAADAARPHPHEVSA